VKKLQILGGIELFVITKKHLRVSLMLLVAALFSLLITACSPEMEHHGYIARPGAFGQISEGMSKTEVEGILGSPSTTASVNFQGDSNYYITSVTEGRSFLQPKEVSREVIAVRFDKNDQVTSFAQYGLEDGRIVDINSRETPVVGNNLSVLQDIFKGIMGSKPGF
jgi:outer membrane protein assembly factor BamE (lipoprotein component of BamABCDE complex)